MNIRDYGIVTICTMIATPVVMLSIHVSIAQVMQSSNYRIGSDSINFGGGLSESGSYSLESSLGEVATGDLEGNNFSLRAGYQQLHTSYIAMTAVSPVVMSPAIPGVTRGEADGSTSVTITTDSAAGYSLSIKSDSSPAMVKGSDSIADYVPVANPAVDFDFEIGSTDAHFGYSPSGDDVASRFLDDTTTCGMGSNDTALACWDGLSTTDEVIARSTGANTPDGVVTTVNFRVGIGSSVVQNAGVYTATTTLTALPL